MSTTVEKKIVVNVPVGTAYSQWTRFEEFPHFMDGVESVTRLSDDRLKWIAHIAGVRREWGAQDPGAGSGPAGGRPWAPGRNPAGRPLIPVPGGEPVRPPV